MSVSGELQKGWKAGALEGGQDGVQKLKRDVLGWIRPSYRPFRAQNWLKWKEIYSTGHCPTPQSCTATHSHLLVGQGSIKTPDHSYGSPLCSRKAASKSRPLYSGRLWQWNLIVHSLSFVFVWKNQTSCLGR